MAQYLRSRLFPALLRTRIATPANVRSAPSKRSFASAAEHDDAYETEKWKKITIAGIITCTSLAIYDLSAGHEHFAEPPSYPYLHIRSKEFPWGPDGIFETKKHHAMTDSGKQSLVIAPLSNGEAAKMENEMSEAALTEFASQQEPKLLDAREDNYDGVIVKLDNVPLDVDGFVSSLKVSLSKWKQQGKKGVWIKVPKSHANLVPAVIEEGFWYDHAEPDYVMLVYWIPESPCTLPANASQKVGVGGFVMNDNRELLVVQEKNGSYRGSGIWKWPTGLLNQGEDIFAGAIREVKEETGIDTEFFEVGGIRHSHHASSQKSDLFFMCILRPLSFDIKTQESEITAARWMPIEEFARQPIYQDSELYKKMLDVYIASSEKRCKGFCAVKLSSRSTVPPSGFYYNDQEFNDANSLNGAVP